MCCWRRIVALSKKSGLKENEGISTRKVESRSMRGAALAVGKQRTLSRGTITLVSYEHDIAYLAMKMKTLAGLGRSLSNGECRNT